jgi:hypothetical protein
MMLIQTQAPPESMSYLPLLQTLVGGFLTLLGGWVGSALLHRRQKSSEAESLKSAFYGEISALIRIGEIRQYRAGIAALIEQVKQSGKMEPIIFSINLKFFSVYESNVGKIGLLPGPIAEKIVLFYSLAFAIFEDLIAMSKADDMKKLNPEIAVVFLSEFVKLFDLAINTGNEALSLINPSYSANLMLSSESTQNNNSLNQTPR